jgi:hypothetical protein
MLAGFYWQDATEEGTIELCLQDFTAKVLQKKAPYSSAFRILLPRCYRRRHHIL